MHWPPTKLLLRAGNVPQPIQIFQITPSPMCSGVQMGNPFWNFPHMAAFIVAQLFSAYFTIYSCLYFSLKTLWSIHSSAVLLYLFLIFSFSFISEVYKTRECTCAKLKKGDAVTGLGLSQENGRLHKTLDV